MRKINTLLDEIDLKQVTQDFPANNWVEKRLVWYEHLIHPDYRSWFASRFMLLTPQVVDYLASIARTDGYDNRKYFAWLTDFHSKGRGDGHKKSEQF